MIRIAYITMLTTVQLILRDFYKLLLSDVVIKIGWLVADGVTRGRFVYTNKSALSDVSLPCV